MCLITHRLPDFRVEECLVETLIVLINRDPILTKCRHACYNVGMKAIQYTIRNVPESVDRYLRKRAKISGQSLNQVIVNELSEKAPKQGETLHESLDWFIGSDDGSMREVDEFLAQEDKIQKARVAEVWFGDDTRH